MTELAKLTIEKARDGLRKKTFSSAELTSSCLNAIQQAKEKNNEDVVKLLEACGDQETLNLSHIHI